MKYSFYKRITLVLLLSILPNIAISNGKNQNALASKYECQLIARSEAINQAKKRVDGKVVGVQLSEKGDRSAYRVRILVNKKRIKTISIPACR